MGVFLGRSFLAWSVLVVGFWLALWLGFVVRSVAGGLRRAAVPSSRRCRRPPSVAVCRGWSLLLSAAWRPRRRRRRHPHAQPSWVPAVLLRCSFGFPFLAGGGFFGRALLVARFRVGSGLWSVGVWWVGGRSVGATVKYYGPIRGGCFVSVSSIVVRLLFDCHSIVVRVFVGFCLGFLCFVSVWFLFPHRGCVGLFLRWCLLGLVFLVFVFGLRAQRRVSLFLRSFGRPFFFLNCIVKLC